MQLAAVDAPKLLWAEAPLRWSVFATKNASLCPDYRAYQDALIEDNRYEKYTIKESVDFTIQSRSHSVVHDICWRFIPNLIVRFGG